MGTERRETGTAGTGTTEQTGSGAAMISRTPAGLRHCLVAGGMAGLAVDVSLFPLDTLKTRLQAKAGFLASGGFKGVYLGLSSAAVGSAPGAALFFLMYESMKRALTWVAPQEHHAPFVHMGAAVVGEVVRHWDKDTLSF